MTHPDPEALQQWLDGEFTDDPRGAEVAAHTAGCARCSGYVAATRGLGDGLRTWATDLPIGDDLTDAVLRAAERPLDAGGTVVEAVAPATDDAVHTKVPGAAQATGGGGQAGVTTARVLPFRRWIWPTLAVAAAMALVVAGRPPRTPRVKGRGQAVVVLPPAPQVAAGASVARVDVVGAQSYAVLEIPGLEDGATTSVVWIQDNPEDIPEDTPSGQPPTAVQ